MPITTQLKYTTDLDGLLEKQTLPCAFAAGDQEAHRILVSCHRGRTLVPVDLSGAVIRGYLIRADGSTVIVDGSVKDRCAVVPLSAACYAVPGRFSLVVKASMGDVIHTILWLEGTVSPCSTGKLADTGAPVLTLDELLAQIAAMEQATSASQAAASSATEAAAAANTAAQQASSAVETGLAQVAGTLARKAPSIEEVASGHPVTADDAAAQIALSLVSHITPIQEGSGAPYPPGCGEKNLFTGWIRGSSTDFAGEILSDDAGARTDYIPVAESTAYTISGLPSSLTSKVSCYDAAKAYLATNAAETATRTLTTPAGCAYIILSISEGDASTGAIAALSDAVQIELGSTATAYTPYANIRPITGWDSISVERTGKNLIDLQRASKIFCTLQEDKLISNISTVPYSALLLKYLDPILCNGLTLTFSLQETIPGKAIEIVVRGEHEHGNGYLSCTMWNANTCSLTISGFTGPITDLEVRWNRDVTNFTDAQTTVSGLQLEIGHAATAFEPGQSHPLAAALSETVYAGTLDWPTGLLTQTHGMLDLGDVSWEAVYSGSDGVYSFRGQAADMQTAEPADLTCELYQTVPQAEWISHPFSISALGSELLLHDPRYADAAELTAAVAGHKLVYRLAQPRTVQLSPQQMELLRGVNHLWSNTGSTALVYAADTQLYIHKIISAEIAAATSCS